jgi:hypothetical protein
MGLLGLRRGPHAKGFSMIPMSISIQDWVSC